MTKGVFGQTKEDRISFSIVNREMIERLMEEGDIQLPRKKIVVSKDEQWNTKQMASKLLKGLENGDSIDDIAGSLKEVIGNNDASAIRNARTMVTGAENRGRLDSYKNLSDQGVVMKKYWIATPDDRTRPSHRDIDGEEVEIDEPFDNGCMYPGDPNGPSEEVWNCRCAMATHVVGFRRADGSISEVNYDYDETTHDWQMFDVKKLSASMIAKAATASKAKKLSDEREEYYENNENIGKKKKKKKKKVK